MTKGPQCKVCRHDRYPHIRRRLEAGRSLMSISNEVGVSYDSLRRHVANDHDNDRYEARATRPEPLNTSHDGRQPHPGVVWEFSDDELAFHDAAHADWYAVVSQRSGVPVEDLRRCWTACDHGADDPCAACDALEDGEPLLLAIEAARHRTHPVVVPGRWKSRAESERARAEAAAREGR